MKKILLLLIICPWAHAFVTVGTDQECDYQPESLQLAISTNDEVRVTNQTVYEPLDIINRSVHIIGGYDDCAEAEVDAQRFINTEVNGQDAFTVMSISTTAAGGHLPQTIILDGLDLEDGMTSGSNLAGGLDIRGNVNVTLVDVTVESNEASTHGGGIYIFGDNGAKVTMNSVEVSNNSASVGAGMVISTNAEVMMYRGFLDNNFASNNSGGILVTSGSKLTLHDTLVRNNRGVENGGGISCSNSELYIDPDSRIGHNRAKFGGGIYASNNCTALIEAGNSAVPPNTSEGIVVNEADFFGAGIYAVNSQITLKGSADHYMSMYLNFTDEDNPTSQGGAIYARGDSLITLFNTRLEYNQAKFGSAVVATEGAKVKVGRLPGDCFADEQCSLIHRNKGLFGSIYTTSCGTVDVSQTVINNNVATDGAVAYFNGNLVDECTNTFEGNVIYGNKDEIDETNSLFLLDRTASLDFAFNTVSDNLTDRIFKMNVTDSSEQTLKLNNSVIWNSPATIFYEAVNSNHYSGNCFLLHYLQNVPESFGNLRLAIDPVFLDAPSNDYQLSFNSPPIDYCDTSLYNPSHHDIISTPRGLQFAPPVLGYFDMGAYEYDDGSHMGDVIYYNRFE